MEMQRSREERKKESEREGVPKLMPGEVKHIRNPRANTRLGERGDIDDDAGSLTVRNP